MITLKTLKWSNAFSYGKNNSIDFTENKVTQLVGTNGNGKSSIAWILEEVLFNKNSKGRKKESILNWYVDDKAYEIELSFIVDNSNYTVHVKRSSTQQVKLIKDGADISSHTATGTFKQIEDILLYNQKTFSQIVCQTHTSSMEFLTSPDTARKKFLIDLIGLNKYLDIGALFKELNTELTREVAFITGKLESINSWIEKYNSQDTSILEPKLIPELDPNLLSTAVILQDKINNVETINRKTANNTAYKQALETIGVTKVPDKPVNLLPELSATKAVCSKSVTDAKAVKEQISKLGSICPTCTQNIPSELKNNIIATQDSIIAENQANIKVQEKLIKELQVKLAEWESAKKSTEEYEKYHSLYDPNLPIELLDKAELSTELSNLQFQIEGTKKEIKRIIEDNKKIESHNTNARSIMAQLESMTLESSELSNKLQFLQSRVNTYNILVKAFSTTGLAAYKLENITVELEELTNNYLTDLSDGRFQISFKLSGNDKLNVIISNNGNEADITTLSAGETTRVNISVLLAIRRLMQNLNNGNSINLLFLDEAISPLDSYGKEKLVEVLLKEENLNAMLVSHEFDHPLVSKLMVVKENDISKLIKE